MRTFDDIIAKHMGLVCEKCGKWIGKPKGRKQLCDKCSQPVYKITHRITLPYACFGISVRGNIVIDSAPIGKWMINKKLDQIELWVKNKQGKVEQL